MKPTFRLFKLVTAVTAVLAAGNILVSTAAAQGTAFTYQGRLQQNGSAATGLYDIRFSLYNASEGGAPVTGSYTVNGHPVSNGLFTVTLDFGNQFPGAIRWLEIGAKTNGAASFETLSPRQYLAATPYAVTAGNLSGTLPASQLPTSVVTNGASGLTLSCAFIGNGAGVTNLDASQLAVGIVPAAALGNAWKTGGNAGTSVGAHFLGTTDNQPLEIKVNGERALRLEPNAVSPNIVGGYAGNIISNGVVGGLIGGGGDATYPNRVGGNHASVLGGVNNTASGDFSTAWGNGATASGLRSTAMGSDTTARGNHSTAMGRFTIASGSSSTAMGFMTTAGGFSSMALGNRSVASGDFSVALGFGAEATHSGSFVWSNPSNTLDSTVVPFSSTAANQFLIRASGGVGIGTSDPQAGLRVSTPGGFNLPQLFLSQTTPGDWSRFRLQSDGPAWDIALGPGSTPVMNFFNGSANVLQLLQAGDAWLNRNLTFDTSPGVRQMIDLWNGEHAIGVQSWTTYFRTIGGATPGAFVWFRGGTHANGQYDAGSGGEELMRLNASGLTVRGTIVSSSDRNVKENFEPVNPREVLEKVAALPLSRWNYKEDPSHRHLGPMAQDFHAAFGVGPDDKHIATVDADGVALAAIQGLNQKLETRSQEAGEKIHQLAAENAALQARIEHLEKLISKLTLQPQRP